MTTFKDSTKTDRSSQTGDRQSRLNLPSPDWNYEDTVKRVEAIISQIESGELELSEVFDQFAAAVSALQQCEQFLTQRQQQMDLLIETLTDPSE